MARSSIKSGNESKATPELAETVAALEERVAAIEAFLGSFARRPVVVPEFDGGAENGGESGSEGGAESGESGSEGGADGGDGGDDGGGDGADRRRPTKPAPKGKPRPRGARR